MKQALTSIFLLMSLFGSFGRFAPAGRQQAIEFRNVSVEGSYPEGITFRIEICGRSSTSRAVFNYSLSLDSSYASMWTREIWTIDEGQTPDQCEMRRFYLETKELEIPPFAPIQYYWSVTEKSSVAAKSQNYTYYYKDGSQDWKNTQDQSLVIWWHDRPDSFGQELMSIAATAYQDQAEFYSITLQSPIVIVIANTPEEFYAWQQNENFAGGMAFPDLNLTIQLVEEDVDYYDWSNDVLPHEISHIYFDHRMSGLSYPPHWLDEGLATYLEYSDHYEEWVQVLNAYGKRDLLALKDLEYDFGGNEQDIRLAYAESYYAVLYMEEQYGEESISGLLSQYSSSAGAEDAFQATFGRTPDEFEKDYLAWLGKRIETPPPSNEAGKPISKEQKTLVYASLGALCLLPLCFFSSGAVVILVLWKLNQRSSVRKESLSPL